MSSTLGLKDTQPHDTSRGFQRPHCEVETSQCDFRVSVVHLLDLTYTLQCRLFFEAPWGKPHRRQSGLTCGPRPGYPWALQLRIRSACLNYLKLARKDTEQYGNTVYYIYIYNIYIYIKYPIFPYPIFPYPILYIYLKVWKHTLLPAVWPSKIGHAVLQRLRKDSLWRCKE